MDLFFESALEREGAQAAAHGQQWQSNPFLLKGNMPQASGESLGEWSRQHDAWQRGFEGYFRQGPEFAHRRREQLGADLLKTMVERQLRRLRSPYDMLPTAEASSLLNSMDPSPPDGGTRDSRPSAMSNPAGESQLPALSHAVSVPLQPCSAPPQATASTDTPLYAASTPEEQRLRRELGIRRIGWRFEYRGYHYDRLADAVAYASLNRAEPRSKAALEGSLPADEPPTLPSGDDRTLMATWDIGFDAGIHTFRNYRYERLCDAVAYARLLASRGGASAPQEHRP